MCGNYYVVNYITEIKIIDVGIAVATSETQLD